jgi:HicB family
MQLDHHIQSIQADLASAAALGDETTAETARRLSDALGASLNLRLLDILDDVSLALNEQLDAGHVEVRLSGREPQLVYVPEPAGEAQALPGDELSARITLRLPESLKVGVEATSAQEGISTNAWVVRALARALDQGSRPKGRGRNRLQGFAQG